MGTGAAVKSRDQGDLAKNGHSSGPMSTAPPQLIYQTLVLAITTFVVTPHMNPDHHRSGVIQWIQVADGKCVTQSQAVAMRRYLEQRAQNIGGVRAKQGQAKYASGGLHRTHMIGHSIPKHTQTLDLAHTISAETLAVPKPFGVTQQIQTRPQNFVTHKQAQESCLPVEV